MPNRKSIRILPTSVHAGIDYLSSALLLSAPAYLDLNTTGTETWTCVAWAAIATGYSILTRYEGGLVYALPMRTHLALDAVWGMSLAASPWLLGFADKVWLPHVAFGLLGIAASLITKPKPFANQDHIRRQATRRRPVSAAGPTSARVPALQS